MTDHLNSILSHENLPEGDFYEILGCSPLSTTEQVAVEYRARVLSCHPDKNPDDVEAALQFKRLQRAKDVLTDSKTRHSYDVWRNSGLAISFTRWNLKKDSMIASMHWAVKKGSKPMIESSSEGRWSDKGTDAPFVDRTKSRPPWLRDTPSASLWKFRNYET